MDFIDNEADTEDYDIIHIFKWHGTFFFKTIKGLSIFLKGVFLGNKNVQKRY